MKEKKDNFEGNMKKMELKKKVMLGLTYINKLPYPILIFVYFTALSLTFLMGVLLRCWLRCLLIS